jgi:hypothetical protein
MLAGSSGAAVCDRAPGNRNLAVTVYPAARQMRCFPVHRHPDARATTWVIEKDELFQRRWI